MIQTEKTVFEVLKEIMLEIEQVSEEICGSYCEFRNDVNCDRCDSCPLDKLYKN